MAAVDKVQDAINPGGFLRPVVELLFHFAFDREIGPDDAPKVRVAHLDGRGLRLKIDGPKSTATFILEQHFEKIER